MSWASFLYSAEPPVRERIEHCPQPGHEIPVLHITLIDRSVVPLQGPFKQAAGECRQRWIAHVGQHAEIGCVSLSRPFALLLFIGVCAGESRRLSSLSSNFNRTPCLPTASTPPHIVAVEIIRTTGVRFFARDGRNKPCDVRSEVRSKRRTRRVAILHHVVKDCGGQQVRIGSGRAPIGH